MRRTLIVTNDFPPRQGGIQSFVHELALRLDPDDLTVYAPKWDGAPDSTPPAVRGGAAPDVADDRRPERHPPRRRAGTVAEGRGRHLRRRRAARPDHPRAAPRRACSRPSRSPTATRPAGRPCRSPGPAAPHRRARPTSSPTWASTSGSGSPGRSPRDAAARMTQLHPGVDAAAFRPDPAARAAIRERYGLGRPPGRGLRLPPGPPQGPGHPAARLAGGPPAGPRRGAAHRRRGSVRARPKAIWPNGPG